MVVADLYQSAGCLPVNVRDLQVDFRDRRVSEVAVRRAWRGLLVRAARFVEPTGTRGHGMAGAPGAIWI